MEPGTVIFAMIFSVVMSSTCAYAIVPNVLARTNKMGDFRVGLKPTRYADCRMHTIRQCKMSERAMEKEIKKLNK